MSPDENLNEQLKLAKIITEHDCPASHRCRTCTHNALTLAELVQDFDSMQRLGHGLPCRWDNPRGYGDERRSR